VDISGPPPPPATTAPVSLTTKTAEVAADQAGPVGQVVRSLTGLSHSRMRGLFDHNCVAVNGEPCSHPATQVEAGDRVDVRYDPAQGYREKKKAWSDPAFTIVHEDQHLIVVNKAAGMLTVATDDGEPIALVDRVSNYLRHVSRQREAFVVHRLDRGVSGLLVFAKSQAVLDALQQQFKQRKPERLYIAIVAGAVAPAAGTIQSHLTTASNLDQFSTHTPGEGQLAITHYKVQKSLEDATAVEVRLETGRRNQIRVHFADRGHPVLGDQRYGRSHAAHPLWPHRRMALHAVSLGFTHPVGQQPLQFASQLPSCMQRLIGK
jgi:23S rRNA pseudouridine1911/1915/1917 synthase